jgi:hypothetical protein
MGGSNDTAGEWRKKCPEEQNEKYFINHILGKIRK